MSASNTPTIHNSARYGEIAPSVLMCGDPLRAKYIAENFLENARQYNALRGMFGFTGTWKGKTVSVQGHGMGCPSMGIYSYELFQFYDVERIVRLGTCGAYHADTRIGELIIARAACTDSNFGYQYGEGFADPLTGSAPDREADPALVEKAIRGASESGIPALCGKVFSSDVFYAPAGSQSKWEGPDVLAAEMEVHALYTNARYCNRQALGLLMVTDNLATGERLAPELRQVGFDKATALALDII